MKLSSQPSHVSFNIFCGSKSLFFFFQHKFDCLISKKVIYYYWYFTYAHLLTGKFLHCSIQFDLGQREVLPAAPFPNLLSCSVAGWEVRITDLQVASTDQSDEDKVANEGGPSFRIAHPLNLFHSALLSFAKVSPQKLIYF